jgi:hypothetical protein
MIETRIFNADVGDESVGNAGPDAIEQDLDNLYNNKAWKEDVLTKNNITPYEPSSAYNPATKKYIDDKTLETLQAVDQSLSLINNDIGGLATNISDLNNNKANSNNVLGLNNETEYTPLTDYNPVTKKYVDDEVDLLSERITNHYITGTYAGNGTTSDVVLSFEPCMVVIQNSLSPTAYTIIKGYDCKENETVLGQITETGFTVFDVLNTDATTYNYIAFK